MIPSAASLIRSIGGVEVPALGFGLFQIPPAVAYQATKWGLDVGYRHFDTAAYYLNEEQVGRAIRDSGIPREQVFVTTKLLSKDHGYEGAHAAFALSNEKLGLGYVDMYLIHSPLGGDRVNTWRALEEIQASGKARVIGVSNFGIHHLEELSKNGRVKPQMNQIELSPYLTRTELTTYCERNGIPLTAYSPLTKGKRLRDPKLVELSRKYNKTPAQVLIRWGLQKGYFVIPRSQKKDRIEENFQACHFSLSEEDMNTLDGFNEDLVTGWDPTSSPM